MKKILLILTLFAVAFSSTRGQLNKRYFYYIGQGLLLEDRYRDAIDVLTVLLRQDTTAFEGYFYRGIAKYNLDDLVGAESDFSRAIAQNSVYTMAYQYRAISRAFMGNYDGALSDFDMAIEIRPDRPDTYYSRGMTYLFSQQFDKAIEDFNYFIHKKPNVVDGYINRGSCYLMLKDTTKAFEDFDKAVEVNVFSADAHLRRGSIYLMHQDYEKAFSDFNKSIAIDSLNLHAYFNRSLTYSATNRPMNAISDLTTLLQVDSTNSLAYFNRAILLSQIGDYNNAVNDYTKVTWYSPDNVLAYYNRAGVNIEIGNLEAAEEDLTKSIELYPDFANAFLNRSHVRYMLGDMAKSKADKDMADKKIADFKDNMNSDDFSQYADTSKMLNRLLSFDSKSSKDFENVKAKDIDIKLINMYRLAQAELTVEQAKAKVYGYSANIRLDKSYELASLKPLLASSKVGELDITASPTGNSRGQSFSDQYKNLITMRENGGKVSDLDLGILAHQMKQYTLAMKHLNAAVSANPTNPYIFMNRAVAEAEMIDFITSIESSKRLVIDNDPVNELKRGERKYNYSGPLNYINRAIELDGTIAYLYYNRANIYCMMGSMPEAIADYTKAIELYPNFANAYYNRGLIQLYLKDTQKGHLDMSRAGELGIEQAYTILRRFVNNADYKD